MVFALCSSSLNSQVVLLCHGITNFLFGERTQQRLICFLLLAFLLLLFLFPQGNTETAVCKHFPPHQLSDLHLIRKQTEKKKKNTLQANSVSFLGQGVLFHVSIHCLQKAPVKPGGTDMRICKETQGCAAELKWEMPQLQCSARSS